MKSATRVPFTKATKGKPTSADRKNFIITPEKSRVPITDQNVVLILVKDGILGSSLRVRLGTMYVFTCFYQHLARPLSHN